MIRHRNLFGKFCRHATAYLCWKQGQSIATIASQADKNVQTIKRWIRKVEPWPNISTCISNYYQDRHKGAC